MFVSDMSPKRLSLGLDTPGPRLFGVMVINFPRICASYKSTLLHLRDEGKYLSSQGPFNRRVIYITMAPSWVKKLTPSGPQGSELLSQERAQSKVPVEKLSEFLFTKEVLTRQDNILKILKNEKVFDKSQNYFAGREDRFQTALARAKRMRQLAVENQWSQDEYILASELISEPGPYGLHASMFLVRRCSSPS